MWNLMCPKSGERRRIDWRARGQGLVEFALASAFLMILLGAAVDAGLAYKSYQSLINASASASSYLAQFPFDGTSLNTIEGANNKALLAFRNEQGGTSMSIGGSTRDLNANGIEDAAEFGATYGTTATSAWKPWFRIDEATSAEAAAGISGSFAGTSDANCKAATSPQGGRQQFDSSSTTDKKPCFIIVRAKLVYRPFFLSPVFGKQITITATSVKPIVGNPSHS